MDYTNDEVAAITKAAKAVGGLTDATPAQLDRFSRVAAEQARMAQPVTVKRSQVDEATKAARITQIEQERTVRLNKIVNSQTAAPRLKRQAAFALKMMSEPEEVQNAYVQGILDDLEERAETRKALVAMRRNAHGADAPTVIKAANMALAKLRDDTLIEIQNKEKGL